VTDTGALAPPALRPLFPPTIETHLLLVDADAPRATVQELRVAPAIAPGPAVIRAEIAAAAEASAVQRITLGAEGAPGSGLATPPPSANFTLRVRADRALER
jgi:hypothetical protein